MKLYLVIRSFASPDLGTHSEGDVIPLSDADARGLGALVMPVKPEPERPAEVKAEVIETAELPVAQVAEQAVIKRPRKKKGE